MKLFSWGKDNKTQEESPRKEFKGEFIREVWDFRLSVGCPILYNNGDTWEVKVWSNSAPNNESICLEHYDTQVPVSSDPNDKSGIIACYNYLYTIRDKYSRDNLEERKTVVATINYHNKHINEMYLKVDALYEEGAARAAKQEEAEIQKRIKEANEEIKLATKQMQIAIGKK